MSIDISKVITRNLRELRKSGYRVLFNYKQFMFWYCSLIKVRGRNPTVIVNPIKLSIEVTSECNSHCAFCPRVLGNVRREKRLERHHIMQLLRDVPFYNMTPFGFGEPMLEPVEDYILVAKKKGRHAGLTTNASLLTSERAKSMMSAGLDYMVVSIDAGDKETYESIRKGLKWDTTVANVQGLLPMRKGMRFKTHFTQNVVICDENRADLSKIIEFWRPHLDVIRVKESWTLDGHSDTTPKPCPAPFIDMRVAVNGELTLCCRDIHADLGLGNVVDAMDDGVHPMTVFNSERMQEVRQDLIDGNPPEICEHCDIWNAVNTTKEYR